MKAKHRKILKELMGYTNQLGGNLDGTSTNEAKLRDRQRAHMNSYRILYAVLSDHPDNDDNVTPWEIAQKAIKEMEELTKKEYPDRTGRK